MFAVIADSSPTASLSAVKPAPIRAALRMPAVILSALRLAILAFVIAASWMLAVLT